MGISSMPVAPVRIDPANYEIVATPEAMQRGLLAFRNCSSKLCSTSVGNSAEVVSCRRSCACLTKRHITSQHHRCRGCRSAGAGRSGSHLCLLQHADVTLTYSDMRYARHTACQCVDLLADANSQGQWMRTLHLAVPSAVRVAQSQNRG